MQAWLFWNLIGLYPITGTTTYLISAPFLSNFSLKLANGNTVTITAQNLAEDSYYVQGITLNGRPHNENWISHDDLFVNGGSLNFQLGTEPKNWDVGSVPPSPGHI
ncbi:hypothetical protein AWJ20_2371 [Sugiyamaella lignohabitans]|uniref:Glycosyl hydrolase family 92 domain-containing protein n=1 Tax=Sugiyamaella lignohabitans TaxID=796027 RepID=A0A167F350_9ASCO|nr:uncharacterized protein AWJ20_2371 [Sugiyamaella lignohabitans]ANB14764.1 hypothetical protein AWJ20_2371 [Sugiyamaella lignohabitans]